MIYTIINKVKSFKNKKNKKFSEKNKIMIQRAFKCSNRTELERACTWIDQFIQCAGATEAGIKLALNQRRGR